MDALITVLVRILEVGFMVGLIGSAIVLLLTLVEDAKSLLPGGEKARQPSCPAPPGRSFMPAARSRSLPTRFP